MCYSLSPEKRGKAIPLAAPKSLEKESVVNLLRGEPEGRCAPDVLPPQRMKVTYSGGRARGVTSQTGEDIDSGDSMTIEE